jgi:hypothetical protein
LIHSYALFSAQYAPHVGGVESFTKNLAHELARAGNAVVVISIPQNAAFRSHCAVKVLSAA